MTDVNVILFDNFETLDAFGPAEIIGKMSETYNLKYFSYSGGLITSSQNVQTQTHPFQEIGANGVLLIPGGMGTRNLVDDTEFIKKLSMLSDSASYVLTVCTGSALLAKTGLLDGRQATTNKKAFNWVKSINEAVLWVKQARWVVDGKFYTSSGVSAGMDMTLGFIADLHGKDIAQEVADSIEYIWNFDKDLDPFSVDFYS